MTIDDIKNAIEKGIPGAVAEVDDPMGGGGDHLRALVIAAAFEGKSLVQQHLMVEESVKAFRADGRLHALQLKTATPQQAVEHGLVKPEAPSNLLRLRRGPAPEAPPAP